MATIEFEPGEYIVSTSGNPEAKVGSARRSLRRRDDTRDDRVRRMRARGRARNIQVLRRRRSGASLPKLRGVILRLLDTGSTLNLDLRGCTRLTVRAPLNPGLEASTDVG
jgi:hypothetical protein